MQRHCPLILKLKKRGKKLGLEQIEHFQTKLSGQAVLLKPDKTIKLVINYGTS